LIAERPRTRFTRLRRLRGAGALRGLAAETRLSPGDLIYPLFVTNGAGVRQPIEAMPGCYRRSVDTLIETVAEAAEAGVRTILLFGVPDAKDAEGSGAWAPGEAVQQAVGAIKKAHPAMAVVTDVCLCEYTDHGHCGVIGPNGEVANDPTLELLARTALSHARAGADMVAPSAMMDGQVAAIREALDDEDYGSTPIMAYSAKYASAFYGPFRAAAGSAPQFGDRRAYQMDPPNRREALAEIRADIAEGADMVMVKPALAYLDVIAAARASFEAPLAAYNVSGEYAMVKAAAANGSIDGKRATLELLTGIKRAGADVIITYHAIEAGRWLGEG